MATENENKILALVLKQSYTDGGYTVVHPETALPHLGRGGAKEISRRKRSIAEKLQANDIVVIQLVDELFERNKKPVRLTLKSSLQDGYVIDFEGKYAKYFEKDGGGWEKWYKEHPKAYGSTRVSLPVYDRKTGLVLVYTGHQSHWRLGSGGLTLYRYEKGELKEINNMAMWIS
jgi:hypothetical protein